MLFTGRRRYGWAAAGTMLGMASAVCDMAAMYTIAPSAVRYASLIVYLVIGVLFYVSSRLSGVIGRLLYFLPGGLAFILVVITVVAVAMGNPMPTGSTLTDVSVSTQTLIYRLTSAEVYLQFGSLFILALGGVLSLRSSR